MTANTGNKSMQLSIVHGISVNTAIDGLAIDVWGSAWTGMEKVWLNGELVSEKRSLRFKTIHCFSVGADEYEVELDATKFYKSEVIVSIVKNGAHAKTVRYNAFRREDGSFDRPKLFMQLGIGFLVGFSGMMLFDVLFK